MAKTLIGIIPKYKGEFTTENYKSVTFQRMNYAKIGEDYYQSLVDDNLGVELTDTNKWMKLTYKEECSAAIDNATNAANKADEARENISKLIDKERVTITLSCNHNETITGKKVYVKNAEDDSVIATLAWQGEALKTEVAPGQKYYVEAGSMSGYRTARSDNFTAVYNSTREVSISYDSEWFYPTMQMEDGSAVSDGTKFTLEVNGVQTDYAYTSGMCIKVPMGAKYTVFPESKDGYMPIHLFERTASETEFRVTIIYKSIKMGVYLQMIDGTLVSSSEYNASVHTKDKINGIAIITSDVQVVFAPIANVNLPWGGWGVNIPGCDSQDDASRIKGKKGLANTKAIVAALGDNASYAAGYCWNTYLPNGKRCYLGAFDEMGKAYLNADAANELSQKALGFKIFSSGEMWTSTACGSDRAWRVTGYTYRGYNRAVAPVSALDLKL